MVAKRGTGVKVVVCGRGLDGLAAHLATQGMEAAHHAEVASLTGRYRDCRVWVLGMPVDVGQRAAVRAIHRASPLAEVILLADVADAFERCLWAEEGVAVVIEAPWLPREVVAWVRNRVARQARNLWRRTLERLTGQAQRRQGQPAPNDGPPQGRLNASGTV